MDFSSFNPTNGFLRPATSIEYMSGSTDDMETAAIDYLRYGVVGAATSAVVGVLNTGIALGSAINIVDDSAKLDEGSVITSMFGKGAGDFYVKHKTGVDIAGLVAGSFVPGVAAIRGLRAAQLGGRIPGPLQVATGLRNPDLVLNSTRVAAAKQSVLMTGQTGIRNQQVREAYMTGVKQQFFESAAFDSALVLTMNQNAALNPDDLGYFSAAKSVFIESIPFTIAGGVLGGGIDILRIKGAIAKNATERFKETGQLLYPNLAALSGLTPGDKLTHIAKAMEDHGRLVSTFDQTDEFAKLQFSRGQEQLNDQVIQVLKEMDIAPDFVGHVMELVKNAGKVDGGAENVAKILSHLTSANRLDVTDFRELTEFYAKTSTPTFITTGAHAGEVARNIVEQQKEFARVLHNMGMDDFSEGVNEFAQSYLMYSPYAFDDTVQGFAFPISPDVTQNVGRRIEQNNIRLAVIKKNAESPLYLVPDYIGINEEAIQISYKASKELNAAAGFRMDMNPTDYRNAVLLHELGHIKTNTTQVENLLINQMNAGESRELFENLVEASLRFRPRAWINEGAPIRATEKDMAKEIVDVMLSGKWSDPTAVKPEYMKYLGSIRELLADGHLFVTHNTTRQIAAQKFPALAKFFNETGGFAKSWDDSKAFYNIRTGETHTSYLPGINDFSSKVKMNYSKGVVEIPELKKSYKVSGAIFADLEKNLATGNVDYLQFDAAWAYTQKQDFSKLLAKGENLNITEMNLPLMERVVTDADIAAYIPQGRISYNGKVVASADDLKNTLLELKKDLQIKMALQTDVHRYNEHHIAKILNIDVNPAMGYAEGAGDWILYGKKDFGKPELMKLGYRGQELADYEQSAMSLAHTITRTELQDEIKQVAAAQVLGKDAAILPDIKMEELATIAPTDSRVGMLNFLRPALASLREKAAYVGKIVNQKLANAVKDTEMDYSKFYSKFNRQGNEALRMEFAQMDNLLRQDWYYLGGNAESGYFMVKKHHAIEVFQDAAREAGIEKFEFEPAMLRAGEDAIPDTLRVNQADGTFVQLSKDLGEFFEFHQQNNWKLIKDKKALADARGLEMTHDSNILYPPPMDLSKSKYHSFVIPTASIAGSDPRRFMIFGNTQAEYNAKMAAIKNKYGDQYRIVTQDQISDFKKLMDDYSKDKVFDEMFFDAALSRQGRTGELLPNLDLNTSGTLQRYFDWTVRNRESVIRSAVELKYDGIFQALKNVDKQISSVARTALGGKFKAQDSIWQDTMNIMLNKKGVGTETEQIWGKVNDFFGQVGSDVLQAGINVFRKKGQVSLTPEDYKLYNAAMADAGFQPPTFDAAQAILASPDLQRSQIFPHMVRTLSNLTSTLMLRMDFAHSIMQAISTPILALPVLQEAKQALRGSSAGKKLDALVNVANPENGVLEPTVGKLFARGTKAMFTDEGKVFMQQLKDRNIVSDYILQYMDTLDFSSLNGSHGLRQASEKIDKVADFASRFSGFKHAEDYTRFQVAWAVKEIGELRGIGLDELWSTIASSVDKVHGVYIKNQRPQAFAGVIGQAVGLYQTYFFNFMQNMLKQIADGDKKQLLTLGAMQSSIFGLQSWPGFAQFNQLIGESNRGNVDLYSLTGANDPDSVSKYMMYGMGSHVLGFPIDFYTRGDLAVRHSLVLPTSVNDFPVVSTIAKGMRNIYDTAKLVAGQDVPVGEALMHGLAHNGMNRPLQGFGNVLRNRVTSNNGQINFDNTNFTGDLGEDVHWGGIMARLLGTRPLNESIIMNEYYRTQAYQANARRQITNLSKKVQMNLARGEITMDDYTGFSRDYERAGGDIQNFNAYFMRQLKSAQRPVMEEFYDQLRTDKELARIRARIEMKQRDIKPWE